MQSLHQGVQHFHSEVFPKQRAFFEHLIQAPQTPHSLFITCSDSRINPILLTNTEPGELFILRNAGNIIPSYGSGNASGEAATIEYAVAVLGVQHVIVCGHWHCGAMHALMHNEQVLELPAVANWFRHAEATRRIIQTKYKSLESKEQQVAAVEQNVLVQLANLRTHPSVAVRMAEGKLQLHAWVYRIETGDVFQHDAATGKFAPIAGKQPLAAGAGASH